MSSSPKPPPAPDPAATANAQSAADVSTAAAQAALNNFDQYTPYGSTTSYQSGSYETPNGQVVPRYTQVTSLTPLEQQILGGQQNLAYNAIGAANGLLPTAVNYANLPYDFSTAFSPTLSQGPQLLDQNTVNAIYGQQKSFLDPQWNQQQQQLQDQLARQGIGVGSTAYSNAMDQYDNARTQAYQSAQDSAISGGTAAAGNLFNMAVTGQNQAVNEQQLQRNAPLEAMQALLGLAPATPSQPITQPSQSNVAPTDVIGAQGLSTQAQQQAYQAQVANQNATYGGVAALGSAAILAVAL